MSNKQGYIYIYKCIVGTCSDICKIGKTLHINDNLDRLAQHQRTIYYGFTPYTEFVTGKIIATKFKVINCDESDKIIKKQFEKNQLSKLEIYNIDYDEAIKEIYKILKTEKQLIKVIEDGYSTYSFDDNEENTKFKKKDFEVLIKNVLKKNKNRIPDELYVMLRDKEDFINNCNSHFKTGNYVIVKDNMILDLNYNKEKRNEIFNKISNLI